jgi:hypothetical protein
LIGHRVHQMLAILCVTSPLALVALGSSGPNGGFCLRSQSFGRPHDNHGTNFRYGCHILRRMGHVTRGVGSFLLRLSTASVEPSCFAYSVVTPQGYKAGVVTPMQPTSSCTISHHSSASFPMAEKKEENRETYLIKTERGFFLRNNIDVPFPIFTGNRPIPQPNWGYDVAWWDICKVQPLCDIVQ